MAADLAKLYRAQGSNIKAMTICAGRRPESKRMSHRLEAGEVCLQMGRVADAVSELRRAVDLWPGTPEPHHALARALEAQGDVENAVVEYRRAAEMPDAALRYRAELGLAYVRFGRDADAVRDLSALEQAGGLDAGLLGDLAEVYLRQGRHEDAARCYAEAIRADPGMAARYDGPLGSVLARLGREGDAAAHLERAVEADPASAAGMVS